MLLDSPQPNGSRSNGTSTPTIKPAATKARPSSGGGDKSSDPEKEVEHAEGINGENNEFPWRAKRYAVKFGPPPCVFLEYEDEFAKRRVRAVKLSQVKAGTDVDKLTKKIIRSFPRKLDATSVKHDQVRKLVSKLVSHAAELAARQGAPVHRSLDLSALKAAKVGEGTLGEGKAATDASSPGSQPLPSKPLLPRANSARASTSHLDPMRNSTASLVSVERFSSSENSSSEGEESDGDMQPTASQHSPRAPKGGRRQGKAAIEEHGSDDDLDSVLNELDRELNESNDKAFMWRCNSMSRNLHGASPSGLALSRDGSLCVVDRSMESVASLGSALGISTLSASYNRFDAIAGGSPSSSFTSGSRPGTHHTGPGKSRLADTKGEDEDALVLELEVGNDVDLNKVTDMELKLAKAAMEREFVAKQIKPGDPGFQYDKQVDFGPAEEPNEWDSDSD